MMLKETVYVLYVMVYIFSANAKPALLNL
jgi:hypothetical protein